MSHLAKPPPFKQLSANGLTIFRLPEPPPGYGKRIKIAKLTYAIIDPFILRAWVSLHTLLKSANLKFRQQRCLSKPPNIMFADISANTIPYKRKYW